MKFSNHPLFRNGIRRVLPAIVVAVVMVSCLMAAGYASNGSGKQASLNVDAAQTNYTAAQQVARLRARQTAEHTLWRDLTWPQRMDRVARFTKRLVRAMLASSSSSAPVAAGFQGNLTVIDAPPGDALALQRQANCSLTLFTGAYTMNPTSPTITVKSQSAGYERTLHDAAGLSTTAGVFPHGCTEATAGIGSRRGAYLGKSSQNLYLFAGSGYNYTADSNVLYSGTVDPTTLTLHSFTNDPSLPGIWSIAAGDLNGDGLADVVGVDYYDSASISVWLAHADGTLGSATPHSLPGVGNRTSAAVVTDVNGDGKLDVVVATRDSQSNQEYISVLLGQGNGALNAPGSMQVPSATGHGAVGSTSTQIVNLTAADLRGSGHPDIVASNGLVLLNHEGDGTFSVGNWAFSSMTGTSSFTPTLIAADFNNDGKPDLAVSNGSSIALYIGQGDGNFVAGKAYASINNVGYLTASDLDGDGNIDLYVGLGNGGFFGGDQFEVGQSYALMGNGDGSFNGAPATPFVYSGGNVADLDGDGHVDAVGVSSDYSFVSYLGDGHGNFVTQSSLTFSPITLFGNTYTPGNIDSYALGDVDGDGKKDLLFIASNLYVRPLSGFDTPGVVVALGNGQGAFGTPTFFGSGHFVPGSGIDYGAQIANLRLADINHDGKTDIVFNFTDQDYNTSTRYAGVAVHLGNGDGTFQDAKVLMLYSDAAAITQTYNVATIADLNKDDHPDLLIMVRTSTFHANSSHYAFDLKVALGNGDGTFGTPNVVAANDVTIGDSFYGSYSPSIVVADMNGDGTADIVTLGAATSGSMQVAIALGNGDGTFKAPAKTNYTAAYDTQGLAVADFNGDSKLDVAVTSIFGGQESGITYGNGDGTLAPLVGDSGTVANATFYLNVGGATTAADFDEDGKMDVLSGSTLLLARGAIATEPDFSSSASSVSGSANAGQSVQTTLTFSANANFSGTIALSCSGLPTGASCAFNPASLNLSAGSSADTTLTINTTARMARASPTRTSPLNPWLPSEIVLAGILTPLTLRRARPTKRQVWSLALLVLVGAIMAACGGGSNGYGGNNNGGQSSGTPAGNYAISINATSGSTTHTLTYTLTVN